MQLSRGAQNVIVGGAYFGDHSLLIATALAKGGVCHCSRIVRRQSRDVAHQSQGQQCRQRQGKPTRSLVCRRYQDQSGWADSHASPQEAGANSDDEVYVSQSIDGYIAENKLGQIDVIMLDIEGGEYEALRGATSVLGRDAETAPAVICEIHAAYVDWSSGLAATPMCKLLLDNGYEIFAIRDYQGNDPSAGEVVELVDIDSAVISGPKHGFNLLAVKSRRRLDPAVFSLVNNVSPKLLHHRDQNIHGPLSARA